MGLLYGTYGFLNFFFSGNRLLFSTGFQYLFRYCIVKINIVNKKKKTECIIFWFMILQQYHL